MFTSLLGVGWVVARRRPAAEHRTRMSPDDTGQRQPRVVSYPLQVVGANSVLMAEQSNFQAVVVRARHSWGDPPAVPLVTLIGGGGGWVRRKWRLDVTAAPKVRCHAQRFQRSLRPQAQPSTNSLFRVGVREQVQRT